MAEQIDVNVKNAVKVVLSRFDDLRADQIAHVADQVWYADHTADADGQADLLRSLELCKFIARAKTIDDLTDLWHRIESNDHSDGKPYGGLTDGGRNYRAARKFIEDLFVPAFLQALDAEFNSLAQFASRMPTPESRIEAYGNADSRLQDIANCFDFLPPWTKKLDRIRERQGDLFEQLIGAEEEK